MGEGVFQFVAAAAHVAIIGDQFDAITLPHVIAGFAGGLLIEPDLARHDGPLRLGTGFAQPAIHQRLVKT